MSAYPMTIRTVSMHQATKSYHLMLITTNDGRSLFVRRWGKKGVFGEVKPEAYDTMVAGQKAWDKLDSTKQSGGYRVEGLPETKTIVDAATLKARMGMTYTKVGPEALNHLDPDLKTDGMRKAEPPRIGEDGRLTGADAPRSDTQALKDAIEAQQAAERVEAEKTLKTIPHFGRFG